MHGQSKMVDKAWDAISSQIPHFGGAKTWAMQSMFRYRYTYLETYQTNQINQPIDQINQSMSRYRYTYLAIHLLTCIWIADLLVHLSAYISVLQP